MTAAKANSHQRARSSPTPANAPAARRRTVTSSPTQPITKNIAWGNVNRAIEPADFHRLHERSSPTSKAAICSSPTPGPAPTRGTGCNVRVVAEKAWHALFARCLFLRPPVDELSEGFRPGCDHPRRPGLRADPNTDGTRSGGVHRPEPADRVVLDRRHALRRRDQEVGLLVPQLPAAAAAASSRCTARPTSGADGDTALFFGLSGTGKTTLSADPDRRLIGDDEHGWSDDGVFNIEGGCYAKTIRLSRSRRAADLERDPLRQRAGERGRRSAHAQCRITTTTSSPRTPAPPTRWTSSTTASRAAGGGHPRNIFFLTCDAFGVLPPRRKLTPEQALYHFLSGYTAKVAGTEAGVTEPQATFSTCFAAPFLPLPPTRYAEMLLQEAEDSTGRQVWLVNTGWTGGPYGKGKRIKLMLHAARWFGRRFAANWPRRSILPIRFSECWCHRSVPACRPDVLQPRKTWPESRRIRRNGKKTWRAYSRTISKHTRHKSPKPCGKPARRRHESVPITVLRIRTCRFHDP